MDRAPMRFASGRSEALAVHESARGAESRPTVRLLLPMRPPRFLNVASIPGLGDRVHGSAGSRDRIRLLTGAQVDAWLPRSRRSRLSRRRHPRRGDEWVPTQAMGAGLFLSANTGPRAALHRAMRVLSRLMRASRRAARPSEFAM